MQIASLSPVQIDNLVLLGQVWGFLKYHHPAITSGQKHWDYELLRQLPKMLAATDHSTATAAMVQWIDAQGPVHPCAPCATHAGGEVQLHAALGWLNDTARISLALSERLQAIYRNRSPLAQQFYVHLAPHVGNPVFDHEPAYEKVSLSDAGFRLLAVYRFWNTIEYWFPYRDVMGEDWQHVLKDAIPGTVLAPDDAAYQRALMALIARVHDTHANLWSSLVSRPPTGNCHVPIAARFIEGRLLVSSISTDEPNSPLQIGDELVSIDAKPVATLVQEWTPYYAASNDAARLRDMARTAPRGACTDAQLIVRRGDVERSVTASRIPLKGGRTPLTHDKPGDAFQLLSSEIAYLKLSNVKKADLASYITAASGTKGLVVDIRNYPSEFVVFALAGMLITQETPFATFTRADLVNPGVFRRGASAAIKPTSPHYAGRVVVLVDEVTQSQAEYTAMALRAVPGALVVGSTTAGADGNMSKIALPAGLRAAISGIGVFYPDRRATQRVGILPDIRISPSAGGLRAGRDEVLEAGIRAILGASASPQSVEKMARH